MENPVLRDNACNMKYQRLSIFRAIRGRDDATGGGFDAVLQNGVVIRFSRRFSKKGQGKGRRIYPAFSLRRAAPVGGNPRVVGFGATRREALLGVIFIS